MCVGSLAGVTYLRYSVLTSSNKSETAVHCCDPVLSVLVMLVSRNVFHVVSALQSFAFISRLPSPSDVFPAKIQNGATVVVERNARLLSRRRGSR